MTNPAPPVLAAKRLGSEPDAVAPDGLEVRALCALGRGSMAVFTLAPGAVSHPVAHRTVEELWYFLSGQGRMWRRLGKHEEVTEVGTGISIAISAGAAFQFRSDGDVPLVAVAVTMPPWPGAFEAEAVAGPWEPTGSPREPRAARGGLTPGADKQGKR